MCPLLVFDQPKIDASPISTVSDIMPNLALISETVNSNEASVQICLNTYWHTWILFHTIIAGWPCNSGGKLQTKLFFSVITCVCIFAFVRQILYEQVNQSIFFVFAISQLFLRHDIINIHTYPGAKFDAQTPNNASLAAKLHLCMFRFSVKIRLFRHYLQTFDRVQYLSCTKCFCINICEWGIPVRPQNFESKLQKLSENHPKQFFASNSVPKSAIFCACVQKFDANEILKLHPMALRNHCRNGHTCIAL